MVTISVSIIMIFRLMPNSAVESGTPGWSMRVTISAAVLPTCPVFYRRPLRSFGRTICDPRSPRERDKEKERQESEPCGCYIVMHGLVIATIQAAYKRGSASIPTSDLRFIAPGWIADSQIPQFVLINSSY